MAILDKLKALADHLEQNFDNAKAQLAQDAADIFNEIKEAMVGGRCPCPLPTGPVMMRSGPADPKALASDIRGFVQQQESVRAAAPGQAAAISPDTWKRVAGFLRMLLDILAPQTA